jgi:predicted O-methyltransferase YrrM
MTTSDPRSRPWRDRQGTRYWWHHLPGTDYVPPIYSELSENEWNTLRDWYAETDQYGPIGECAVPLLSILHGLLMGSRVTKIVQLGTCAGYSALLLGWMLKRMKAERGLFTLDIDPASCETSRRWIMRAGLQHFVEVVERNSLDPDSPAAARNYLGADPELVILDSSHEYAPTLAELDLWYEALAGGGLFVLHDVSRFAAEFDVGRQGGVGRAFSEWRKKRPEVETFCLNGGATTMELPRPLYKDACGLGLIHKPMDKER